MKFWGHDQRLLGEINNETHVFTKIVRGDKDKVKEPAGWAVELGPVDTLKLLDCLTVELVDRKAKVIYSTAFENFITKGVLVRGGYGDAILVADEYWDVKRLEE